MEFKILFPQISLKYLAELRGERGPFFISVTRGDEDHLHVFFYGDEKYQFRFNVVQILSVPGETEFRINEIFPPKFCDEKPVQQIPREDLAYLEANVAKFLNERDFLVPKNPIRPNFVPKSINFAWGAGR